MDEQEINASTEDVLHNLGLFTNEGELKNAAILLFGKNVRQSFPAANFKIGRFHTDESDLIIQDDVEGNIIQMANRVMELLRSRYLVSPIHYEGMQRIEQLEVPEKALRELIYNAISHKDYTGPAIQMRVYDRSIELWNFGLLPEQLTPATLLQQHSSYPRNRNIANVFYKAGFVESWGRGFKKISEEFERANMPLPIIEETGGGVKIIIKRKTLDEFISERDGNVGNNVGNVSETNVGNMSEINLTERQRLIVSIIKSNPRITGKAMSETLSVTQRTIERDLSVLQKAKIIRHEGKFNDGIWVVLESQKDNG